MRTITVLSMITLDGVIQGPGAPREDTSGHFRYGGWIAPYDDEVSNELMAKLLQPSDLLLGRTTFEIWEQYWPQHADSWPGIMDVTKYVVSKTRTSSGWSNTVFLTGIEDLKKLKASKGNAIQVWGSSEVVQFLLEHDMVDELWLMIHPLTLGKGKKLFNDKAMPAAFTLTQSRITTKGAILAHYKKAGEVITGTVGR